MSLVSFVKVSTYNRLSHNQLKQTVLEAMNLIGYPLPNNIEYVIVKPNMCYYWDYSTGQTTNPKFVAALIDVIRDQTSPDVDISIVESDASAMRCKYAFKILGYEKMAQKYDVKLVNLSQEKGEKVKVSIEGQCFNFTLPQTIQKADLRINIPKIKYMMHTKISCALKNIFGCNPNAEKFKYHPKLDETIVALNKVMKFDLCVLDGIIVAGSLPRKLGLIMASQDPVSMDVAVAKIVGINPSSVRHIVLASREGLGNVSFIPKGVDPKFFRERYPRRKPLSGVMYSAYRLFFKMGLLNPRMI